MVGKKSGKALLREEGKNDFVQPIDTMDSDKKCSGLERTDNNMDLTSWPQVNMINQKNYYTLVPLRGMLLLESIQY